MTAVCIETPTRFARYTCASNTTIPKGTLLALTSPNTASACAAVDAVAGGIAWMEKDAADPSTEITAALDGVWGITASTEGNITIGMDVVSSDVANMIAPYDTLDDEDGLVFGKALETFASVTSAVIKVRLNI